MAKKSRARGNRKKQSPRGKTKKAQPTPAAAVTAADPDWKLFVEEFKDEHPELIESAIYALPQRLIDTIQDRIPGFFSEQEATFERNLARLGGAGFFMGEPFYHPLLATRELDPREIESLKTTTEAWKRTVHEIEEMLDSGMREEGRNAEQIKRIHDEKKRYQAHLQERQSSYLGWLITNPCFQSERDAFFDALRKRGLGGPRLPDIPISFFGEAPSIQPEYRALYDDMLRFFCRWCIRSFSTWDLPIPIAPQMTAPTLHYLPSVDEAGMLLFDPWYLLRDRDFNLYELLEHELLSKDRSHLEPWLRAKSTKWGHTRYARMFQLYVYLELALKKRYPDRIRGNTECLDLALSDFLRKRFRVDGDDASIDGETVKKIRLEMYKRLRGERDHVPGG